jgi:hypothetical protein
VATRFLIFHVQTGSCSAAGDVGVHTKQFALMEIEKRVRTARVGTPGNHFCLPSGGRKSRAEIEFYSHGK